MRKFYKISCFSLILAGSALAQGQGQTGAQTGTSAQSQTSVSAGKSGAAASNKNSASATAGTEQAAGSLAGGSEINAKLSRPVDASKNKPGDEVTATAAEDIKSGGKVVIPKGSKLIGHVTEAQPRGSKSSGSADSVVSAGGSTAGSVAGSATNKNGSGAAGDVAGSATGAVNSATGSGTNASGSAAGNAASKLGIVFDRAVLKDGREVPLNATIQAVAAGRSNLSSGMGGLDSDVSGAGSVASSGRAAGGGLVGGVAGGAGGAVGAVGRTAGGVGGTVNSTVGGTAGAAANVTRSSGAVGGLNATGQLTSGSKGVFGLKGLDIASSATGSAQGQGSLITSATRNVRLESGTSLLLVTGAQATGSSK